ncbi:MAG: YkgJ family cysteine cluster protein [bacterium]
MKLSPFTCAGCGNCCRGEGFVAVTAGEITEIAAFLGMPEDRFRAVYTRRPESADDNHDSALWLVDQPGPAQECVLLEGNRCRIHPVKPQQCRDFPRRWRSSGFEAFCGGMRR